MKITDSIAITSTSQAIVFPNGLQMPSALYNITYAEYVDSDGETLGGSPVSASKDVDGFTFTTSFVGGTFTYTVELIGAALGTRYELTGNVAITTNPQTVTFASSRRMPSATYKVRFRFYDSNNETIGGKVLVAGKTATSFVFEGMEAGTLEYTAVESGLSSFGYISPPNRLSRDWTAQRFYAELVRDLDLKASDVVYGERFNIIERAINQAGTKGIENLYATALSSDDTSSAEISIADLRIAGEEVIIESSGTQFVDMVDFITYKNFRTGAFQNRNRIVFTRQGENLLFKKSSSLSDYGNRTVRFQRTAELYTSNSHRIDFPDILMSNAIAEGRKVLAVRYQELVGKLPEEKPQAA